MNFATVVKEKRAEANLSYRKLSEETGISHSHIRDIENGKHTPSFENAIKLASTLDINVRDVVVSTYQTQLRNLLFELIKTCDDYNVSIPYDVWVKSNLPMDPMGTEKMKLHDKAFEIVESLYNEKNENALTSKLEVIEWIARNPTTYSSIYKSVIPFIETVEDTSGIHGLPKAQSEVDQFIDTLQEKNVNYGKGDE
ncbi:helix-turn-helix domain-containing protein [Pontibacillus litoralis]|uniref:HTH cro/C1-type domain-containing protein n=1 Tax=Pontibacillus litoralis JSM 072002 TaxID=1385512 RepID=A0A0A5G192_9BACI|nr:helix-turn-helix domain-containing protein [Pontibacillus litoralis]KGX84840.1 hypothetical protein N784_11730 [Pontibacillus litoralis JSM 072002]